LTSFFNKDSSIGGTLKQTAIYVKKHLSPKMGLHAGPFPLIQPFHEFLKQPERLFAVLIQKRGLHLLYLLIGYGQDHFQPLK